MGSAKKLKKVKVEISIINFRLFNFRSFEHEGTIQSRRKWPSKRAAKSKLEKCSRKMRQFQTSQMKGKNKEN